MIVILQVVTLVTVHLSPVPMECPECSTTTPTTDCPGNTDTLTGDRDTCDNTELIAQMNQLMNYTQNNTELLKQLIQIIYGSPQILTDIVRSLSLLETVNSGTQSIVHDILVVAEELLSIQNGSFVFSSHLPISCQDIKENYPNSPSG